MMCAPAMIRATPTMIRIDRTRTPQDLVPRINRLFALSADKIRSIERTWQPDGGAPVFTVEGRYTARGWTEWTEGFQYGSALLQFDATGEREFLELGRERTLTRMAPHLTHVGVHDHGFNNVSTYGALWRMADRRPLRRVRVGAAVLCARAQGQRRRAGAAVDDAAGWRLHLFVQRRPFAVRRHDPLASRARPLPFARPSSDRGAGCAGQPPDTARPACARDRDVQRLLWDKRRTVRRARTRRARKPLQRRQRNVSRTQHAAGILAVQHVDARTGVGHARICRAARIPRDAHRRRRPGFRRSRRGGRARRRGARHMRLLHRLGRVRRWRPLLGHGRAGAVGARRLGQPRVRSVQRCWSPSTARRRRSAHKGCCASAGSSSNAATMAPATRRRDCA